MKLRDSWSAADSNFEVAATGILTSTLHDANSVALKSYGSETDVPISLEIINGAHLSKLSLCCQHIVF